MSKHLITYRLYNRSYGVGGNPKTLVVRLRDDNTLSYVYYGGWQSSGMGFCISNMQLRNSLPITIKDWKGKKLFKNVEKLHDNIVSVLKTGCGSNDIDSFVLVNNF